MEEEKTIPVTIRLTPSVRDRLAALARDERRTFSQYVRLVLERYLEERPEE